MVGKTERKGERAVGSNNGGRRRVPFHRERLGESQRSLASAVRISYRLWGSVFANMSPRPLDTYQ